MRRLGVDPGSVRIGLAISDEDGRIATPLATVLRAGEGAAADRIAEQARQSGVEEIVVGLPLRMDGTEGDAARRARSLGDAIAARVKVPIVYWDERLTTVQAERALSEADVRGPARRAVVDQAAATLLLQSYLDARTEKGWSEEQIERLVDAQAASRGRRAKRGAKRRR